MPVILLIGAIAIFLVDRLALQLIFAQQTVAGLAQGAIFGSLALALVLIYRATEVINFAQGEMAMAIDLHRAISSRCGVSRTGSRSSLTLAIAFVLGVAIQLAIDPAGAASFGDRRRDRHRRPLHPHRRPRHLEMGR